MKCYAVWLYSWWIVIFRCVRHISKRLCPSIRNAFYFFSFVPLRYLFLMGHRKPGFENVCSKACCTSPAVQNKHILRTLKNVRCTHKQ